MLVQLIVWLNTVANALGSWLLAPLALMPGPVSATLVAVVTGVLLLAAFKYTSNQRAIKRVRDDISANLLALKLFKESARVALQCQGRLLVGAGRLFLLALLPMAAMFVPVLLILGQVSLWYQQRPLKVGEEAVVTVKLNDDAPLCRAVTAAHRLRWRRRSVRSAYRAGGRFAGISRQKRAATIVYRFRSARRRWTRSWRSVTATCGSAPGDRGGACEGCSRTSVGATVSPRLRRAIDRHRLPTALVLDERH